MLKTTGRRATQIATLAVAPALAIAALAGTAVAASNTPPWEPDQNALGNLVFQDANGNVLTGGSNLNNLFYQTVATTPWAQTVNAGTSTATLFFAAPNSAQANPVTWFKGQDPGSGTYTYGTANPSDVVGSTGADLADFLPSAQLDSTPGYANVIQVRVYTQGKTGSGRSAPTVGSSPSYWESDVAYNPANASGPITVDGQTLQPGSWAQVYPAPSTTTTTPPSSVPEFANPAALVAGGTTLAGLGFVAVAYRRRRRTHTPA